MGEIIRIQCKHIEFVIKDPDIIIFQTRLQAFKLLPDPHYRHKKMNFLSDLIQTGEVKDMNDLAHYSVNVAEWIPVSRV